MLVRKRIVSRKRRRQHSRRYYGLTVKGVLQFLSSLILPLMLGVFTVVITFQQQKLAQEQRMEDKNVARQQRLEDRNESQLQREQDKNESRLYREQDKNESQSKRDQDWKIAQEAQAAQNKIINDQYPNAVLIAYIKEIGDLLETKNGSLTSDPLTHTLARVKTLNAIRELDGTRQIRILRFLYEASQLTTTNESIALDISTAELIGIDFRKSGELLSAGKISLAGVYLVNSTFGYIVLKNVNFSSARFDNVNFSSALLDNVTFSSAEFRNVNFSSALLDNVTFSSAEFRNVDFSSAWFKNAKFSSALLDNVSFSLARFDNVNFSSALLDNITFSSAEFRNVDFSSAWFKNANFSSARFVNVSFSLARFDNVNFSSARLYDVNFSSASFDNVNFSSASLRNVNFSSAHFTPYYGVARFDHARMSHSIFDKCNCEKAVFSYANLKNASFHSATLFKADFFLANLQDADFTNSTMTDTQLESALSIRNAKLPNGTLGQGRNLIKNGYANCNTSLLDYWQVKNGSIMVTPTKENSSQCHFSLQSKTIGAIMSQRVALVDIWDSSFWTNSKVELNAQMSNGVSIEVIGKTTTGTIVNKEILRWIYDGIIMDLKVSITELEVVLKFNAQQNVTDNEDSWCGNIELFLNYDTL